MASQNRKKIRKINRYEPAKKFFIFCEGIQTEPLYFKGFEEAVKSNPLYKNTIEVHVEGVGADTLRVIYAAENYVNRHQLTKADIWCVYDKDSFPKQDFNAVSAYATNLNVKSKNGITYHVAWSNQCIEYWFILHFAWYISDNDRTYYIDFLDRIFKNLGLKKYQKNDRELFRIMTEKGAPKQAIKFADKRLQECIGYTDSQSVPATKVHLLVVELAKFLPESIQMRYL